MLLVAPRSGRREQRRLTLPRTPWHSYFLRPREHLTITGVRNGGAIILSLLFFVFAVV
jgi:hypothetical protein